MHAGKPAGPPGRPSAPGPVITAKAAAPGRHHRHRHSSSHTTTSDRNSHTTRSSAGFALPMALVGAMGLLLGSLALQSAGLAARYRSAVEQRLLQAEDRLASGAHRLVGTVSRLHGCLLALPLERWTQEGALCSTPEQREALLEQTDATGRLELIRWQPRSAPDAGATEAEVEVELRLRAHPTAGSDAAAEPGRRQIFVFSLADAPQRPRDLRSQGLRGVLP